MPSSDWDWTRAREIRGEFMDGFVKDANCFVGEHLAGVVESPFKQSSHHAVIEGVAGGNVVNGIWPGLFEDNGAIYTLHRLTETLNTCRQVKDFVLLRRTKII